MVRNGELKLIGYLLFSLMTLGILQSCGNATHKKVGEWGSPAKITVEGDRFVDEHGRQVILNGINVVNKSKEDQYLFAGGADFYANLKSWGFNCIRFIIIWDGLEPEPGVYNEQYLQEIDKRIQWASDNGLFVVLDMHQDLYSVKYSDGAPQWATLDEGKPHTTGAVWSDAYLMSDAVQTAFDNFWANKAAPDGMGLQDHYANLWRHIAGRYADNPTVIGYDIMNEPFPGSSAQQAMPAFIAAYGEMVYTSTGKVLSEEELMGIWSDEHKRTEALKGLTSREKYAQVIDALHNTNAEFEKKQLQPMYQKVADAIREVDTTHVLFLEHSYFSNMGVESSIERVLLKDGTPDKLVAYAPHGYDLVTDTKEAASSNSERVKFIFDRIEQKGQQLGMPIWLGEWGAYYGHGEEIVSVARDAVGLIESNLFGNAYWSYDPGTEKLAYFEKALLRPYPAYTNGKLLNYHYCHTSGELIIEWIEPETNPTPTAVYVPWLSRLKRDGLPQNMDTVKNSDSDSGWLLINPTGQGGQRRQVITFLHK